MTALDAVRRRRAPCAGDRPRAGMTLAEVLIALAVVGILVGIALPRLDYQRYRVNGGLSSLVTTFAYAQRLAVTLQSDVRVGIDVANRRLRIHEDQDNDNIIDPNERVRHVSLDDGLAFGRGAADPHGAIGSGDVSFTRRQDGLPVLVFRRDGTASEDGGLYLNTQRALATGASADARAVAFTRATGRATAWTYVSGSWRRRGS